MNIENFILTAGKFKDLHSEVCAHCYFSTNGVAFDCPKENNVLICSTKDKSLDFSKGSYTSHYFKLSLKAKLKKL